MDLEALKARVVNPLTGIKVACYYGCIMNRPPELMKFDHHENPMAMDNLMAALGAEVVPFPLKVECCGASFGIPRRDIVMRLSGKLLDSARGFGADALVTACPLCQMNLDMRQGQINDALHEDFKLPVFYYIRQVPVEVGHDCFRLAGADSRRLAGAGTRGTTGRAQRGVSTTDRKSVG